MHIGPINSNKKIEIEKALKTWEDALTEHITFQETKVDDFFKKDTNRSIKIIQFFLNENDTDVFDYEITNEVIKTARKIIYSELSKNDLINRLVSYTNYSFSWYAKFSEHQLISMYLNKKKKRVIKTTKIAGYTVPSEIEKEFKILSGGITDENSNT